MVSETQEATRRTVTATIEGTETSGSGGPVVTCSIKEIDSRFPTKFYNLSEVEIAELPRGATLRIIVERGGLKKDKDGNLKLGNYPNDYFWNYMGLAGDQEIPATPTSPIVTPAGDARQSSIERQVAYKEAVSLIVTSVSMPEKYEDWTSFWDLVFRATNIGERILNRTYTEMTEELEGIPSVEDEVKEKDDDHLF